MLNTQNLIEVVSGQRRGLFATLTRFTLGLATPLYRAIVGWRNWRFDQAARHPGMPPIQIAKVPVISVGNLTTGGTGKTPLVIWVARLLRSHNWRVAIVSRGYGAERNNGQTARNDEAIELEFRLPDVPHLQDPDRFRMAQTAVEELESQVIVLDDGFQHRQLHRELDIVLIDATNPFGFGRLLPRGLLREPLGSLQRADAIVLTRCELVEPGIRTEILAKLKSTNPVALLAQLRTRAHGWLQFDGRQFPLSKLHDESVFAFCGIGNPSGFFQTLTQLGFTVCQQQVFADHHHFSRQDLEEIAHAARATNASALVCTHKDLVKIGCNQIDGIPVLALLVEVEFLSGQAELTAAILAAVTAQVADIH